jgi:hypothetical protein
VKETRTSDNGELSDRDFQHLTIERQETDQSEWRAMSLQELLHAIQSAADVLGIVLRDTQLEILQAQGKHLYRRLYPKEALYRFSDFELMKVWLQRVARVTVYVPWKCTERDQVDAIFPI